MTRHRVRSGLGKLAAGPDAVPGGGPLMTKPRAALLGVAGEASRRARAFPVAVLGLLLATRVSAAILAGQGDIPGG